MLYCYVCVTLFKAELNLRKVEVEVVWIEPLKLVDV
jgi:hypothetical protein